MQAIQVEKFGSYGELKTATLPEPEPGPGQVRVRNKAIALNFIDTYYRTGLYGVDLPFVPGLEAAGVVEALGEGTTFSKVGDRVVYIDNTLGAYAEAKVVDEAKLIPLPDGIDEKLAAGITLKGITAHYLARSTYPVKEGDWVLLHAAAGATGSILTQLLVHLGANVIGTAGTDEKVKKVLSYGAHHAINYQEQDFVEEVKKITGGKGVDVVYDSVGKATTVKSMQCLKVRGMMVSFGNASGAADPIKPLDLLTYGSIYLTRPTIGHYTQTREELLERAGEIFSLILDGAIRIEEVNAFTLADAAKAHEDLENRRIKGPTVFIP